MVTQLKVHPVAGLFPPMTDEEFAGLVADIKEHGQRDPVVMFEGRIVDGVHRYKACRELGIELRTVEWHGSESDLTAYVISQNLHRRHLSTSQRAMVAEKIASYARGRPSGKNLQISGISMPDAAGLLNVGGRTISTARQVRTKGVPELAEAVEKGDMTVGRASQIAKLPKEQQRDTLNGEARVVRRGPKKKPLERISRAIDTMETAVEILDTEACHLNGDSRQGEWADRLRVIRRTPPPRCSPVSTTKAVEQTGSLLGHDRQQETTLVSRESEDK